MESGVRVVASAPLSSSGDARRYVVVDAATGEIVDDAQGYGYKSAQNAYRAHAYKSIGNGGAAHLEERQVPSGSRRDADQTMNWVRATFTAAVTGAVFWAVGFRLIIAAAAGGWTLALVIGICVTALAVIAAGLILYRRGTPRARTYGAGLIFSQLTGVGVLAPMALFQLVSFVA